MLESIFTATAVAAAPFAVMPTSQGPQVEPLQGVGASRASQATSLARLQRTTFGNAQGADTAHADAQPAAMPARASMLRPTGFDPSPAGAGGDMSARFSAAVRAAS